MLKIATCATHVWGNASYTPRGSIRDYSRELLLVLSGSSIIGMNSCNPEIVSLCVGVIEDDKGLITDILKFPFSTTGFVLCLS